MFGEIPSSHIHTKLKKKCFSLWWGILGFTLLTTFICNMGGGGLLLNRVRLLRLHGLYPVRLFCPWDFPGKNTRVGFHFLLQGIFLIQGLNTGLLHRRWILYSWTTGKAWKIALFSHTSKVMLKIIQARLQQYVNRELTDVQDGFWKGKGSGDQIANIW